VATEAEEVVEESDVDRLIGANVQRFRTAKKLSQAQLADSMSVRTGQQIAQQTILKIEKGTRPLRYSEAVALAAALDVPLNALSPDRLVARERASIDIAGLDATAAFSYVVQSVLAYLEAAAKLKVILDESPNAESLYTATELELLRWMAEGEYVQALGALSPAMQTMPDMPDNPNPPF
jgi:transcriptional regulator with XRE-family HTH domain